MDIAPFGDFQVAPEGVTLDQFDDYVEETRQKIRDKYPDLELDGNTFIAILKARATRELQLLRESGYVDAPATEQEIQSQGIVNNEEVINDSLQHGVQSQDWQHAEKVERDEGERVKRQRIENPMFALQSDLGAMDVRFCLIDKISQYIELAVEVCFYVEPTDILNLFCISKRFNETISANITSSIRMWVRNHAEESGEIFSFRLYRNLCIPDPVGRTNAFHARKPNPADPAQDAVRHVPSLRWYQMVVIRENCVNDIIEELENAGQCLPRGIEATIKKIWLLMDIATTDGRRQMLQNKALWTTHDLFNWQMFWVKLNIFLGDPLWPPPGIDILSQLILGQRSLIKLWQMLTGAAFTDHEEYRELMVRYSYMPSQQEFRSAMFGGDIHGVEAKEVATVHLEGWGRGTGHLYRPDELIPAEAARRGIQLDKHVIYQVLWGRCDSLGAAISFPLPPFNLDELMDPRNDIELDSDDEPDLPWSDLSHFEKAELLLQNLDGQSWQVPREYLQGLQTKTLNRRAEEEAARGECPSPDKSLDDIDLSALPDPSNAKSQRQVSNPMATAILRSEVGGNAPITPAIQAAIDQAGVDRAFDTFTLDIVNMRLFGMTGVPADINNMNRGNQAWSDYEREDYEPEWREYVDEINMPDLIEEGDGEDCDTSLEFFGDDGDDGSGEDEE